MKGSKRFVRVNPTGAMILNGLIGEGVVIDAPEGPYYTGVDYVFGVTTGLEGPQYDWSLEPGMEIVSGQGTSSATIRFTSGGVRSVRVAVTDQSGMTYRGAWMDHVGGLPPYTASVTHPGGTLYTATNYTFTGSTNVPTPTYTWSVGSGATIVSGQGTASVVVSFSESGSRSVTLTVGGGGSASATWSGTVEPWIPSLVSGLALWLDASDASTVTLDGSSNVELWADKSGNGRDATQSTVLNRPNYSSTLGLRVTTGQRMDLASNLVLNDCTVFGVYSNTGDLLAFTDSPNSVASNSEGRAPLYWSGWSGGAWNSSLVTGTAPNIVTTGAFTGPQVLRFRRNGTTLSFAIGTSVTTKTAATTAINVQTPIGNRQTNLAADYRLRELVVYSRSLTDGEVTSVYSYLKAKWSTP